MSELAKIVEEIRLAAAPFAGERWDHDPDCHARCVYRDDDDGTFLFRCDSMEKRTLEEEAQFSRYIAAASPGRILALLSALEAATGNMGNTNGDG